MVMQIKLVVVLRTILTFLNVSVNLMMFPFKKILTIPVDAETEGTMKVNYKP